MDNLEDVLYKIRDDFALSTQENITFRDEASKETDSRLFAFIRQSLDESNFWNDDLWSYHTLEHQRILLEAIKATKPTCAIRNPSTSLLKALEANHTVYIKNYITFFTELPLKLGFLTNPIPGHIIKTLPTVDAPLSYWDYAPVIQTTPLVPLFLSFLFKSA